MSTPQTEARSGTADLARLTAEGHLLGDGVSQGVPWYVLYTRCHHESKTAGLLARRGFPVLFPKYRTWSGRKDRRKVIERPLFPGYLLFQTEPAAERLVQVSSAPGAAYILGDSGGPRAVAGQEMSSLIILLSSGECLKPHPYFQAGDLVRVASGSLAGVVGAIQEVCPEKRRLVVSVDMLGRSVAVDISDEIVERL
jgi:transcription antitermination factor NusG